MPRRRNYTRIVCISDTHNTYPKLPSGDVLIHAGDLTNQGSHGELQRSIDWLVGVEGFKLKIVVAGNHDLTLDHVFAGQDINGSTTRDLVASTTGICYLNHEAGIFDIAADDNNNDDAAAAAARTRLKVFASPYSPSRGPWAFGYAPEDGATKWADIPLDTDVVITHTPPKFHCDQSPSRGSVAAAAAAAAGCEDLRRALWRVRPRLAVCGHVHEGRGVETVLWDLDAPPHIKHAEAETFYWKDATVGTKKQFRVDLAARSLRPLRNDGSTSMVVESTPSDFSGHPRNGEVLSLSEQHASSFHGIGGLPATTHRCDVEALAGRQGRQETCIVNAAIMGSSWPHPAGKRFNKPIVIDIELPTVP